MSKLKQFVEHYKRKLERYMDDENLVLDTIHKLSKAPLPADVLQESGLYVLLKFVSKKDGKIGCKALSLLNKWKSVISDAARELKSVPAKAIDETYQTTNQNPEIRRSNTPLDVVNKIPVASNQTSDWESSSECNLVIKCDKKDHSSSAVNTHENEPRFRSNSFNSRLESNLKISHHSDADFLPCDNLSQSSDVHLINKETGDMSTNEASHCAKGQIIAPYSIDLKEGMFRVVKIKPEKPSKLSILKDYCSQEELVKCDVNCYYNNSYDNFEYSKVKMKNSPCKREADKADDRNKKTLSSPHKKEKDKSNFDKSKLPNSSLKREKDAVDGKGKLPKSPYKKELDKSKNKLPNNSCKYEKDKINGSTNKTHENVSTDPKQSTRIKKDSKCVDSEVEKKYLKVIPVLEKKHLDPDKFVKATKLSHQEMKEKAELKKGSEKNFSDKDKTPTKSEKRKRESNSEDSGVVKNGKLKFHTSSKGSPNCVHEAKKTTSGETELTQIHQKDSSRNVRKRELADDEAAMFLSHKKERTSVYSGKKSLPAVLSLKECCIHVLKKNIDTYKSLKKVPYELFKPVLECCNPTQLMNIEHHNKYLMEHTSELWKKFCQKYYKDEVPQKHETWRNFYLRADKGKEKKLKGIIASIAASKSKSQPERQLKLADAPVKYSHSNSKFKKTVNTGSPSVSSSKVSSPASASKISSPLSTTKVLADAPVKHSHSNSKLIKNSVNTSSPSVSSSKISPSVSTSKISPPISVSKASPPLNATKIAKPSTSQKKQVKKAAEAPLMSKVKKSMGLYKQK